MVEKNWSDTDDVNTVAVHKDKCTHIYVDLRLQIYAEIVSIGKIYPTVQDSKLELYQKGS